MARICAEIDAQNARKQTNNEPDAMRTDMVTLLGLLRGVHYVQTVGDINTIRLTCDRVEQRWGIKTQREGDIYEWGDEVPAVEIDHVCGTCEQITRAPRNQVPRCECYEW